VTLWTRTERDVTRDYPAVARALEALKLESFIFDGEATGGWGRQGRADYNVFDVLWLNGKDLRPRPLRERLAALGTVPFELPVARVRPLKGSKPWERACGEGWEGVIAKRLDSRYEHRRSKAWLKMKCDASQELVVGGFTDPRGAREGFGALLVGYFDKKDFVFAGKVGAGLTFDTLRTLRLQLDRLEISKKPFTRGTGLPRHAHWVEPEIVVQVLFSEWTEAGKLRHPRLQGVRTDKPARDVVREQP
jgi:bifunctional non-homologous end joining protein LigD